jgi:pimeloyl-ACP methyl ester carboxylesterase
LNPAWPFAPCGPPGGLSGPPTCSPCVTALDLPSHGIDDLQPETITMQKYVQSVLDFLDSIREPVVLVAYSLGGMVITAVASPNSRALLATRSNSGLPCPFVALIGSSSASCIASSSRARSAQKRDILCLRLHSSAYFAMFVGPRLRLLGPERRIDTWLPMSL